METINQLDLLLAGAEEVTGPSLVLESYDRFVVFFSGGKDSVACVLWLLDQGVDRSRIELHHHLVDGSHEDIAANGYFMDWPITTDYCRKFAAAFGLKIYFSWKEGGFLREMERSDDRTAPISFETEDGRVITTGGDRGKLGTRRKFPQQAASLITRWCSAYLKVDVGDRVLRHQIKYAQGRTLVLTGERAEESSARASYETFEPHRADSRYAKGIKRHIDHYRPVHGWPEAEVWAILEAHRVRPHPAYEAGYGRVSCMNCIFSDADQWATNRMFAPEQFNKVKARETDYGVTISRTGKTIDLMADKGTPYAAAAEHMPRGMQETFDTDIIVAVWKLPAGAFSKGCGPT